MIDLFSLSIHVYDLWSYLESCPKRVPGAFNPQIAQINADGHGFSGLRIAMILQGIPEKKKDLTEAWRKSCCWLEAYSIE